VRAGQALRGSSEFHAWGDSNLYLRRQGEDLSLAIEHRAAPSVPALHSSWPNAVDALALEVVERSAGNATFCERLAALAAAGRVTRSGGGYRLVADT
jgi:hypothetical protein